MPVSIRSPLLPALLSLLSVACGGQPQEPRTLSAPPARSWYVQHAPLPAAALCRSPQPVKRFPEEACRAARLGEMRLPLLQLPRQPGRALQTTSTLILMNLDKDTDHATL